MPNSNTRKSALIPLLIAAAAALIAIGFVAVPQLSSNNDAPPATEPRARSEADTTDSTAPSVAPTPEAATMARRQQDDPLAMGKKDAPVVLVEYSDFQCPFCGRFARETKPKLIQKYVRSGTLRIEWRDFPYLGEESKLAARAGRAAANQGKFWKFHDAMYADQPRPNSGLLTPSRLTEIAGKLGLNKAKFRTDLSGQASEKAVKADLDEGIAIGVTGTPAFLINGRAIMGAQPTDIFEQAIEEAAKQS